MVTKLHGDYDMEGVVFYQSGVRARSGSAGHAKSYDAPLGIIVTEDRISLVQMRHLQNGLTAGSDLNTVPTALRDSWVVERAHRAMLVPVRSGATSNNDSKVVGILRQVDQGQGEAEAERLWQTRHHGRPSATVHIKGVTGAMAAKYLRAFGLAHELRVPGRL